MDDGAICDSYVEAYIYLKYKSEGIDFLHNKYYGKDFGLKRYDFYIPSLNKFVEVTGYNDKWWYWEAYRAKIENKRKYAESIGASFEFIQVCMDVGKRRLITTHLAP